MHIVITIQKSTKPVSHEFSNCSDQDAKMKFFFEFSINSYGSWLSVS